MSLLLSRASLYFIACGLFFMKIYPCAAQEPLSIGNFCAGHLCFALSPVELDGRSINPSVRFQNDGHGIERYVIAYADAGSIDISINSGSRGACNYRETSVITFSRHSGDAYVGRSNGCFRDNQKKFKLTIKYQSLLKTISNEDFFEQTHGSIWAFSTISSDGHILTGSKFTKKFVEER